MQAPGHAGGRILRSQRILILAPCPYPSALGTAVCIRALAYALATHGHAVDIVTYAGDGAASVFDDGPTTCHAVTEARIAPHSGPQRTKWRADRHLWRYAQDLGRTRRFDLLYGHHVEGILLGRALQSLLRLPLVGHLHTRLGLELPSYLSRSGLQAIGARAGALIDRVLPHLADAIVALNTADAALCRQHAPSTPIFVRHPCAPELGHLTPHRAPAAADLASPQKVYAIYSGNADAYQNLALLCAAAQRQSWPLVIATHGPTTPFDVYGWPDSTRIIRVEGFAQMRQWLQAARVGVCPRLQPCGYPIKWLNYWQAGLPLVATAAVGEAVFGPALGTHAHGPALWVEPTPASFGQAITQTFSQPRDKAWTPPQNAAAFDAIFVAAQQRYAKKIF